MELLIYGNIGTYSVSDWIDKINESEDDTLTLRVNSNGGDVQAGFGLIAKFREFEGEKHIKVDGKAFSMGAYLCVYADKITALDVSEFLIHRAAYDPWVESNPEIFTEEWKKSLIKINKDLRKALEAKIDTDKFESITGHSLNDVFNMDNRLDVILTAQQAKQIGLIDKIDKITPMRAKAVNSRIMDMAANYSPKELGELKLKEPEIQAEDVKIDTKIKVNMNKQELKEKHPDVYAEIRNEALEGSRETILSEERNRVSAWNEWATVDAEAVKAGIDSGKQISMADISKFSRMMASKEDLKDIEADATDKVVTDQEEKKVITPKSEAKTEDIKAIDDVLAAAMPLKSEDKK